MSASASPPPESPLPASDEPPQAVRARTAAAVAATRAEARSLRLVLGAVAAFGSIGQFLIVLLFGVIGVALGLAIEGRVEIKGLTDRWGR